MYKKCVCPYLILFKTFLPILVPDYNIEMCTRYKLLPCYDPLTLTGPDPRAIASNTEDESDQEETGLLSPLPRPDVNTPAQSPFLPFWTQEHMHIQ